MPALKREVLARAKERDLEQAWPQLQRQIILCSAAIDVRQVGER